MLIGSLHQSEAAVDEEIVEVHVARLATHEVAVLHPVELTVLHIDVIDVCVFLKADDLHTVFRFLAGHILHIHVANGRIEASTAYLVVFVVKVDLQD